MSATRSWILAGAGGGLGGAAIGTAAAFARTGSWDPFDALVFALATGIPLIMVIQAALASRGAPSFSEDDIEHTWVQRAHAQTLLDVFIFAGLITFACSITGHRTPGLEWVLGFAMVDALVRMRLLQRAEG